MNSLTDLTREILHFRDERDWSQFHTPRQLAAALAIEVAELQEVMLWKSDEEVCALIADPQGAGRLRHEIADVLIYALLIAAAADVDPTAAVREKLVVNAERYPVSQSRGKATKYTELG